MLLARLPGTFTSEYSCSDASVECAIMKRCGLTVLKIVYPLATVRWQKIKAWAIHTPTLMHSWVNLRPTAIINPRRISARVTVLAWSFCPSVCLSTELQKSVITSTRQLRYEQAKHHHGLQCDSWILQKWLRSRDMTGTR